MQKTIKINLFYSNMDSQAQEKYEILKDNIKEVLNNTDNKALYLGVTVEESEA